MKNGCGGTTIIGFKTQNALWFIYTEREDSQEEKTAFINYSLRFAEVEEKKINILKWKRGSFSPSSKRRTRKGRTRFGSCGTVTAGSKAILGIVMGADSRSVSRETRKFKSDDNDKLFFLTKGIGVLARSGASKFSKMVCRAVNEKISTELSSMNVDRLTSLEIRSMIEDEMNSLEQEWDAGDLSLACALILGMYDYSDTGIPIPILIKFKITKGKKTIVVEHKNFTYGGCYTPPNPSYLEEHCTGDTSIEDNVSITDIFICLGTHQAQSKAYRLRTDPTIGGKVRICVIQPKGVSRSVLVKRDFIILEQDMFEETGSRIKFDLGKVKSLKRKPATYRISPNQKTYQVPIPRNTSEGNY